MGRLVIDVADVAHKPGAVKQIQASVPAEGLRSALGGIQDGNPVDLHLSAESFDEGIWVSGDVGAVLNLQCSRCLVEYEQNLDRQVDEIFYYNQTLAEQKDAYPIEDDQIDLEPMIRDLVVLDIPTKPLHSQECKGLCSVCGSDLNVHDCGHGRRSEDPRWAPLESLLGRAGAGEH